LIQNLEYSHNTNVIWSVWLLGTARDGESGVERDSADEQRTQSVLPW